MTFHVQCMDLNSLSLRISILNWVLLPTIYCFCMTKFLRVAQSFTHFYLKKNVNCVKALYLLISNSISMHNVKCLSLVLVDKKEIIL